MTDRSPYAPLLRHTPVRRAEVELRGAVTRYHVYGPPSGRLVVFLHGLRGDHHGLEPIVAHLQGAQVVVPDLPGFGGSGPLPHDRHDVDGYAAWTRDLLTVLAPGGDAVLAGHSFGSIVATAAARRPTGRDPARGPAEARSVSGASVRALVLVNPIATSALAGPRVAMTRLTVAYHRAAAALPERTGTALLRNRLITRLASVAMVTTRDPALRRWIHAEHGRYFSGFHDRRVLLEAFDASIGHDVAEYAAAVSVPTLLVAAERDEIAPPAGQHALAGRFPDARLVMVAGTGHLAHYEAPAAVAQAIAGFLAWLAP